MYTRKRFSGKKEAGQELVEFAIVLPVLMLFLVGILDVGRIFHAIIVIGNAAREGARYGSIYGCEQKYQAGTPPTYVYQCYPAAIRQKTIAEAANSGIVLDPILIQVSTPTDRGQPLRVTVGCHFTFIMQGFLPGTGIQLRAYNEMIMQ